MLFELLTINGNNLYKTFRNKSPGCKLLGVTFVALLESQTELLSEPFGAVKKLISWGRS